MVWATLIAAVLQVLHQAGWLTGVNGFFYDHVIKWLGHFKEHPPAVVLIRVIEERDLSDEQGRWLIKMLTEAGAEGIVFNFMPKECTRDFYILATQAGNIVFGRKAEPRPEDPEQFEIAPLPPQAEGLHLQWGAVSLAPAESGIHRRQMAILNVDGTNTAALELKVATLLGKPPSIQNNSYLVNFSARGRIPILNLHRVLNRDLLPEIVKGRTILIGIDYDLKRMNTPISQGNAGIGFAEFQSYALQTLITNTQIMETRPLMNLLILLLATISTSFCTYRLGPWGHGRITILFIAIVVILDALSLIRWSVWFPAGTVILAIVAQSAFELAYKNRLAHLAVNEFRLRAASAIEERFLPHKTSQTAAWWERVTTFLGEVLNMKRYVVLQRIGEKPRLQPIRFHGLNPDHIQPELLSLEYKAFSAAITNQKPTIAHQLLGPSDEQDIDFVCPLIYEQKLIGLWLLRVGRLRLTPTRKIEPILTRISNEMARIIATQQTDSQKTALTTRFKTWLANRSDDQVYRELLRATEALAQYYEILEIVFDQISIPTLVYDSWGRLIKINAAAKTVLEQSHLPIDRPTLFEFLEWVLGHNPEEARAVLQNVVLENSHVSRSLQLPVHEDRQFLLRVYPLVNPRELHLHHGQSNIRGIICELIETTPLSTLASLKGIVADRLGVDLRNHLAAIKLSAALLESDSIQPWERSALLETIQQKIDTCVNVLRECQKYLNPRVDISSMNLFPVDALALLERACEQLGKKAVERGVEFQIDSPQIMTQVLATPMELANVFFTILNLLVNDAAENSKITIHIKDEGATVTFTFVNSGVGIPEEILREILTSPEEPTSEEFKALRQAILWVQDWGGALQVSSDVGKGYEITLQLRQFQTITKQAETLDAGS